jgi:hypothetical protein
VGNRQTVERSQLLITRLHLIGLGGCCCGHFRHHGHDGVDLRIDTIDLLEVLCQRFTGGEFLRMNELRHLHCAGEAERGGRRLAFSR